REALHGLLDQEATDTVIRHRPDHRDVGDAAIGDPHLGAIQNPVLTLAARVGSHVSRVRSAVRFGEPEAGDELALRHSRQILLLLRLAPEGVDRVHAQARLDRDETADAGVTPLELLADESVAHRVEARTAIALEVHAEQAELCKLRHDLAREAVFFEAFRDDRQHLFIDEARHRISHHLFLFRELPAHIEQVHRIEGAGGSALRCSAACGRGHGDLQSGFDVRTRLNRGADHRGSDSTDPTNQPGRIPVQRAVAGLEAGGKRSREAGPYCNAQLAARTGNDSYSSHKGAANARIVNYDCNIMDLGSLSAFVKIVQSGSFTKAADALGSHKAHISRSLAHLEQELGIKLLERTTRRVRLTDVGQQVYDQALGIMASVADIEATAAGMRGEPAGVL